MSWPSQCGEHMFLGGFVQQDICGTCGRTFVDGNHTEGYEMDDFKKMLAVNAPDNSWTEDFSHENGMYACICIACQEEFMGHKRRVVCKKCHTSAVIMETP